MYSWNIADNDVRCLQNPSVATVEIARQRMHLPRTGNCTYDQFCHIWHAAIAAANGELLVLQKAFPVRALDLGIALQIHITTLLQQCYSLHTHRE